MRPSTAFFSLLSLLPVSLVIATPVSSALTQISRRDDTTAEQVMNIMGAAEKLIEQFLPTAINSINSSDPTVQILQGFLNVHQSELSNLFDPALDNCTFSFNPIQSSDPRNILLSVAFLENYMTIGSYSLLNNVTNLGLSQSNQDVLQSAASVSHLIATVAGSMAGLDQEDTDAALQVNAVNLEWFVMMKMFQPSCSVDLGLSTLAPSSIETIDLTTPFTPGKGGFIANVIEFAPSCANISCSCQTISTSATGVTVSVSPISACQYGVPGPGIDLTLVTLGNETLSTDTKTRAGQTSSYAAMIPYMFAPQP